MSGSLAVASLTRSHVTALKSTADIAAMAVATAVSSSTVSQERRSVSGFAANVRPLGGA